MLNEILERLEEIRSALNDLHGQDELTPEDEARFDELSNEFDDLNEKRVGIEARAAKMEEIRTAALDPANVETAMPAAPVVHRDKAPWDYDELRTIGNDSGAVGELRSRAIDSVERASRLTDEQREKTTRWLESIADDDAIASFNAKGLRHVVAVSNPEYSRAFNSTLATFARTGMTNGPGSEFLMRAMSLTDAAGGYAVPLAIDPTIVVNDDGTESPFRAISTVKQITTDSLRAVSATAVSASWDGEEAQVSDDAVTIGNTDITVYKAQAFVPFSIEIGQDFPDLQGTIGGLIATEKGDLEAAAHATGSGTNQPIGIVTALTGGSYEVASNTTDTFAIGDVYDLEEELPAKFRRRASWAANKKIYQAMREAGGANLDDFWVNLGGGQPKQLLGYPALESSEMDGAVGSGTEDYVLVFGDFSNYWIVDRVGLGIELVPHLFATANNRPSGQRGLYAHWRTGADSVNDRAFRMLNCT